MRRGKQGKFSHSERTFAWHHKMTAVCQTVIQLIYQIVLWGFGGTKLQNHNMKILLMFLRCPKPSCAGKRTFSLTLRIHTFHYESEREIWMNAINNVFVRMFFVLFCVPNVKQITNHASIKILILLKIHFLWIRFFY